MSTFQTSEEADKKGKEEIQQSNKNDRPDLSQDAMPTDSFRPQRSESPDTMAKQHSTSQLDFHEDMDRWKSLYKSCLGKLQQLQNLQKGRNLPKSRRWQELNNEMEEAARVLNHEYAVVEEALQKHSKVLTNLMTRLRKFKTSPRQDLQTNFDINAVLENVFSEKEHLSLKLRESEKFENVENVSETINKLRVIIAEHDNISAKLDAERARRKKLNELQAEVAKESDQPQTEGGLKRTSSLLKLQVKRLNYELSRLSEAQSIESDAAAALLLQVEADTRNNLDEMADLTEANASIQEGLACHMDEKPSELFRRASRLSFLHSIEDLRQHAVRRERLESRFHNDRVYKDVEILDEESDVLHCIGIELNNCIDDMKEELRETEAMWHTLRQERDALTKYLHPEMERLNELQEVAKDNVELESKLRKENVLFINQFEEFQKDLLDIEADLLTGKLAQRLNSTKHLVSQIEDLRDSLKRQNEQLKEEMKEKRLTISRSDSVASLYLTEEQFQQKITDNMRKLDLRIKADMDRHSMLKTKKYVLEAPGKAKIHFRGQRNVIKTPSKIAEWRKKAIAEKQEATERQVDQLRKEIVSKLAFEKERATEQLLRYEAERHGLNDQMNVTTPEQDAKVTGELQHILGLLETFMEKSREDKIHSDDTTGVLHEETAPGDFGDNMKTLILQLDKLQNALEGNSSRGREHRTNETGSAFTKAHALFDQLPKEIESPSIRRASLTRRESNESEQRDKK